MRVSEDACVGLGVRNTKWAKLTADSKFLVSQACRRLVWESLMADIQADWTVWKGRRSGSGCLLRPGPGWGSPPETVASLTNSLLQYAGLCVSVVTASGRDSWWRGAYCRAHCLELRSGRLESVSVRRLMIDRWCPWNQGRSHKGFKMPQVATKEKAKVFAGCSASTAA